MNNSFNYRGFFYTALFTYNIFSFGDFFIPAKKKPILNTVNKMPPKTTLFIPNSSMKIPHTKAAIQVPTFVATKNKALAKSGTLDATLVIQY